MARAYKRDAKGRFAGGGGGGSKKSSGAPKSKAGATRAANTATTNRLWEQGMRGTGSRLRTSTQKLYSGTKATKQRNEGLWRAVEGNQRAGAKGEKQGAQFTKAKVKGTIGRKR